MDKFFGVYTSNEVPVTYSTNCVYISNEVPVTYGTVGQLCLYFERSSCSLRYQLCLFVILHITYQLINRDNRYAKTICRSHYRFINSEKHSDIIV
jgi:hypothetical protein